MLKITIEKVSGSESTSWSWDMADPDYVDIGVAIFRGLKNIESDRGCLAQLFSVALAEALSTRVVNDPDVALEKARRQLSEDVERYMKAFEHACNNYPASTNL